MIDLGILERHNTIVEVLKEGTSVASDDFVSKRCYLNMYS